MNKKLKQIKNIVYLYGLLFGLIFSSLAIAESANSLGPYILAHYEGGQGFGPDLPSYTVSWTTWNPSVNPTFLNTTKGKCGGKDPQVVGVIMDANYTACGGDQLIKIQLNMSLGDAGNGYNVYARGWAQQHYTCGGDNGSLGVDFMVLCEDPSQYCYGSGCW